MTMTYDATAYLTAAQYAERSGRTDRTIKRWLAEAELPGAYQDERGRWMIPANAERIAQTTDITPTSPQAVTRRMTSQDIDTLPSFLTVEQAAHLLGISRHAIAAHRDYFDVVPFGPNGSLVIPLATIKRIRG
jgi:hypothetical protein